MNHAAKLVLLLPFAPFAKGQAIPAARGPAFYTGFHLPDVSGTLRYSLSASERIHVGATNSGYSGDSSNISGNIAYLSSSPTQPFSLVYSGGYLHTDSGGTPSEVVQTLALSQVLVHEKWKFVFSDSVQYLPESPSTGLSGIPGLGDVNVPPVVDTGQDILTKYAQRVTNRVSGTVERELTGKTSLSATGSQSIIRYLDEPNGSTTDNNSYSGSANLQHHIDARTSAGLNYVYNTFSYLAVSYGITTQMIGIQFERSLSRRSNFSGSIGPQHISSSSTLVPARTNVSGNASLSYNTRAFTSSLTFSQAASGGSGLAAGAQTTSLHLNGGKQFGRAWHVSANTGYLKTSSLTQGVLSTKSVVFGTQANRSLWRYLSVYASYTLLHQIASGSNVPNLALSGLNQSLAFGVTYSPEAFHFGH